MHRPKLLVCVWAHWNFDFTPQLQHPLAHYQGPIVRNVFYKKDAYGKYLLFATLGSYVAWLVAKVFKFLWRVIFGGFSAEDEQRPKLVSAHPQIPLWFEKSVMMWNSTFCKLFFPFFIVIFWTVSRGQRQTYNCHSSFQKNIWPYSTSSHLSFFHKSGNSTLTLAGALICFITPPFSYTKISVRISPIGGYNSNWNI